MLLLVSSYTMKICAAISVLAPAIGIVLCSVAMVIPAGIAKRRGQNRPPFEIRKAADELDENANDLWKDCAVFDCPVVEACPEARSLMVTARAFCVLTCIGFLFLAIVQVALLRSERNNCVTRTCLGNKPCGVQCDRSSQGCLMCVHMTQFCFAVFSWALLLGVYINKFCEWIILKDHYDIGPAIPLLGAASFLALVLMLVGCCCKPTTDFGEKPPRSEQYQEKDVNTEYNFPDERQLPPPHQYRGYPEAPQHVNPLDESQLPPPHQFRGYPEADESQLPPPHQFRGYPEALQHVTPDERQLPPAHQYRGYPEAPQHVNPLDEYYDDDYTYGQSYSQSYN